MANQRSILAITLGEPWSINIFALSQLWSRLQQTAAPVVLIGSAWQWQHQLQRLGQPALNVPSLKRWEDLPASGGGIWFLNIDTPQDAVPTEQLTPEQRGRLSVASLQQLAHIPEPVRLAVLTCPIDKATAVRAGFPYHGQTEMFADLWQDRGIMILAGPKLRVGLCTNHLPLRRVADKISAPLIMQKLETLIHAVRQTWNIARPRIGVCGLNPHCSDQGLFGWEDAGVIQPAIELFNKSGAQALVTGPIPADTAFARAVAGEFDAILAMYHDQGLGPLKTVHFYDAINVTGGLKHLRVSPDHGPAQDKFLRTDPQLESFHIALTTCQRYLGG